MVRPKGSKNKHDSVINEEEKISVLTKKEEEKILPDVRRDNLIQELREKLLTKTKLQFGGSEARRIHAYEVSAYAAALEEINKLGKIIGKPIIGLGHIRKG